MICLRAGSVLLADRRLLKLIQHLPLLAETNYANYPIQLIYCGCNQLERFSINQLTDQNTHIADSKGPPSEPIIQPADDPITGLTA